jgi:16S rRNA (guanine527-N7)-methyltransferase
MEKHCMLPHAIKMNKEDHRLLQEGARKFGVTLSRKQLHLFALFLEGLWSWNRRINITGVMEKREIIIKLLLDPLVAVPYLSSSRTLLDIGSGAGIPGLPIKIARPELEVHLIESKAKKVSFLRYMIRKLGLKGIKAYWGRAGQRAGLPTLFPFYDIVTARALAPLEKTCSICCPHLEAGGLLVTFKGSRVDQEIKDSERLMRELHLRLSKIVSYSLPETGGKRCLLILEKGGD